MIEVGARIPSFELPDQDGKLVTSRALLEQGPLVLYFYPKDDTPGCTVEACTFRDGYQDFVDAGAQVVGVSSDGVAEHKAFAQKHRLPFRLLSDRGGALRKQLGVPRTLGFLDGRVTFVIDREGVVRHAFNSQLNPTKHVDEALRVIRSLSRA